MKQAVCLLLPNPLGTKFLAVSRKENPFHFGFPGGKVDEGETPTQTRQLVGSLYFKAHF